MAFKVIAWLGLMLVVGHSYGQLFSPETNWTESEVPAPPAFTVKNLIAIDMPSYVSVRLGVDPDTLTITPDGVVRYVVVAVNASGTVSAMFEGIRCASAEVKTYARFSSGGPWSAVPNPQWQDLKDNLPSRHAAVLARQGVCDGRSAAAKSAQGIVQRLTTPRVTY